MKNMILPDDGIIEVTAPTGGVVSGQGVIVGTSLFGVAVATAAEGALVNVAYKGVYRLPTSASLTAGGPASWDNTAKAVVSPGTGKFPCGIAIGTVSGYVDVLINAALATAA